jgi:hypothetical protein
MIRQFHYSRDHLGLVVCDDEDPDLKYHWYPNWPDESVCKQSLFFDEQNRQDCIAGGGWIEVYLDPDLVMDVGL